MKKLHVHVHVGYILIPPCGKGSHSLLEISLHTGSIITEMIHETLYNKQQL